MKLTKVNEDVLTNKLRGWTDLDQTLEDFIKMHVPVAECDVSSYKSPYTAQSSITSAIRRNHHESTIKARVRGDKLYLCNQPLLEKEAK